MTNSEMIINIIKTRRNTKKFKDTEVSNEIIESLLDSAIWAPNHRSTEPWRFFVIQKSSTFRSKLTEHMIKEKESISNTVPNLCKRIDSDNKQYKILGFQRI